MVLTPEMRLRGLLGEDIPAGGTEADTLFTDLEISDLILEHPTNMDRAAYEGWRIKAARLSNLVDTTEGNSQRKFSDLLDNASDMIRLYLRSSSGPTEGRTRIGRIRRPGVEW